MDLSTELVPSQQQQPQQSLVPAGYAEKAMASLMQLHTELMDEKERRVDLYRRLMEKEQALAELKLYVKMLEERVQAPASPAPARAVASTPAPAVAVAAEPQPVAAPVSAASAKPAVPSVGRTHVTPKAAPPVSPGGWKTW